jgi:hypothetical protein
MTLAIRKMGSFHYQACLTVPGEITACSHSRTAAAAATSIVRKTVGRLERGGGFMGYSKRNRKSRRTRRYSKRRG